MTVPAPTVALPRYDRSRLTPGIVHIGLGNFHRAHMAVYLDDLFALGEGHDWAILGAGVRAPDAAMREALLAQDCLSTVIELDPAGKSARRIGSMIGFLPVQADNAALIAAMAEPAIRIVSLTVTEGGYFINPATGRFDPEDPAIQADAIDPRATAFGAIVAALKARRAAGHPPFTVMSCDNLPGNGDVTRAAVTGLAGFRTPNWPTGSTRTSPSPTAWSTASPPPPARANATWPPPSVWTTPSPSPASRSANGSSKTISRKAARRWRRWASPSPPMSTPSRR